MVAEWRYWHGLPEVIDVAELKVRGGEGACCCRLVAAEWLMVSGGAGTACRR